MSITNLSQSDKFRSWLNKINEIIDALNKAVNDITGKAPKVHTSPDITYGAGDSINYGHVMLSDATDSTSNASKGIAATPLAVKAAYDKAQSALTLAESIDATTGNTGEIFTQLQNDIASKAPLKHSSTQNEYGLGSTKEYGHVKLSVDLNSELDASNGVAVAPLAIKNVNDKITTLTEQVEEKAKTYHNSDTNIYGVGNATEYGHVKLSDDVTSDLNVNGGVAATIGVVKSVYDLASKADVAATNAVSNLELKSPTNHASETTIYGIASETNYGHVKVTDNVNLDSNALTGIVPSAKALKDTYTKANLAYTLANELKDSGVSGGGVSSTTALTNEDLNTVIKNGVYISNTADSSKNYPYSSSSISVLEVNSSELTVVQRLYNDSSLYIRNSINGGGDWSDWMIVSNNHNTEFADLYISIEHGDDNNSGLTPLSPIASVERLFNLINVQSILASNEGGTPNIVLYFDRGDYTDFSIFANFPMPIQITSYLYGYEGEGEGTDEDPTNLEENKPYFPELYVVNSHVSLSNIKVDSLYAYEHSIVIIESNEYFSVGHIESITNSIVYISSLYKSEEDDFSALHIHNTDPTDSIFVASDYGKIYDTIGREVYFVDDIEKNYIFECSSYGEISLSNITIMANTFTAKQYSLSTYGSLYYPSNLIGNSANNYIEENTKLQGILWGGGNNSKYLRADGSWSEVPKPIGEGTKTKYLRDDGEWHELLENKTHLVSRDYTITQNDIKRIILVAGDYKITVPSLSIDASFYIKNISSSTVTIITDGVRIDGFSGEIPLTLNEFIHVIQYSDSSYAIIAEDCKYVHDKRSELITFNTYQQVSITDEEAEQIQSEPSTIVSTGVLFDGGNENPCCGDGYIVKLENENIEGVDLYKCENCGAIYKTVWQ